MSETTDLQAHYVDNSQLDWIEAHYDALIAQFAEEWIAILNNSVVAHAATTSELNTQLVEQGIDNPLIMWIASATDDGESPLIV